MYADLDGLVGDIEVIIADTSAVYERVVVRGQLGVHGEVGGGHGVEIDQERKYVKWLHSRGVKDYLPFLLFGR